MNAAVLFTRIAFLAQELLHRVDRLARTQALPRPAGAVESMTKV